MAAARELLRRSERPTAIIAGNDLIALGCLDVLAELGLRCPADISLIGFNDMPMLDRLTPPLATVQLPQHAIGEEAARLLLERISEPDRAPKRLLLPCQLMLRGSTAAPSPG